MSAVITPFEGTELFNTASFNNRISQINTGFSYVSNPNLLDNWYFGNPVNQRGQTEYTGKGYTVDRWKSESDAITTKVISGGITISTTAESGATELREYLEYVIPAGTMITISAIVSKTAASKNGVVRVAYTDNQVGLQANLPDRAMDYELVTVSRKATADVKAFVFRASNGDGYTVHAAKLELGSQQTLAHQDADGNWVLNEIPDYGEQLRRCQRYGFHQRITYAYGYCANDTLAYVCIPCPASLRKIPVITVNNPGALNFASQQISSQSLGFANMDSNLLYIAVFASGLTPNTVCVLHDADIYIAADL